MMRTLLVCFLALYAAVAQAGHTVVTVVQPAAVIGGTITIENNWEGLGTGTTAAATVTSTSGRLLVVACVGYGGNSANHAVTDEDGNTYVNVARQGSASVPVSLWYLANSPANITTITFNGGASVVGAAVFVYDVSGCSTSAPFTSGEVASDYDASTGNPVTGSVTNATANSIYFALAGCSSTSNPATMTVNSTGSSGGTWALFSSTTSQELNGSSYVVGSSAYLIVSSSASRAHGWTTEANKGTHSIIACFH